MLRTLFRLLLPLALVIGACSASDTELSTDTGDLDPLGVLHAAPAAQVDAGTMSMRFTISLDGLPDVGSMEMTGDAAFDFDGPKFWMDFDFGQLPGGALPMDFTMSMISDGEYAYLASPLFAMMTGGDESTWLRVPLDIAGSATSSFAPVPGGDPTAMASMLGGSENIEVIGTEQIDGVSTTHFRGEIDPSAVDLDEVPEAQRPQAEEAIDALGDTTIPVDVWIGDDGLIRRMRMDMSLADADPTGALPADASMQMQMDFFDYGEPVSIEVPADWVDGTDLLGGAGFGGLGGN